MKLNIAAFLFAFLFLLAGAKAQQTHFIYIQTSDKQAFYVKMGKNVYSSSVSGYLIISKLLDSTYNLSIGFPKSEWPQQNFDCTIDGNDKGYLLKNFGDKGWGLFNLQTLDVTMAGNKPTENNSLKEERTDSFSNMLSAVVKDPGIKMTTKKAPEVKTPDTIQPVAVAEPATTKEPTTTEPETITDKRIVVVGKKSTKKSTIIKLLDRTDNDGTQLVYLDIYPGHKDTVRLFIPADKTVAIAAQKAEPKKDIPAVQDAPAEVQAVATPQPAEPQPVKEQPKKTTDKKFIDMDMSASNTNADTAAKPVSNNTDKPAVAATTNNCRNIASEEDFLKLRKKMASEDDDDKMVSLAYKVFKSRCFTTAQVKNLGALFLDDKGRYSFFDMAYPYVSDSEYYNSLESQLSEPYYINRFKALINH